MSNVQATEVHTPIPVVKQMQAIYRRDDKANCVALVWPEPLLEREITARIDNKLTRFVFCYSELAMREALIEHDNSSKQKKAQSECLVLLSKFDEVHLAKDVLARIWKNEPQRISPWKTLEQLIKVREVDPRLLKNRRWMAEALLGCFDRYQQKVTFGEVLDQDTAWQALALGYLDYDEPTLDIHSLFSWSVRKQVTSLLDQLPADVKDNLADWLDLGLEKKSFGKSSQLIQVLLQNGQGDDLLAIGLACSVLYHNGIETLKLIDTTQLHISRGVFKERFLSGQSFDQNLLQQLGLDAVQSSEQLLKTIDTQTLNGVFGKAEQILASLDMMPAVELSNLLSGSLRQRLSHYAQSLTDVLAGRKPELADAALFRVRQHVFAGLPEHHEMIERAEMAARLVRWLQQVPGCLNSATNSITEYVQHGSFVDWARSVVWSGDVHEDLNRVYQQLSERVSAKREQQNKNFAQQLESVARSVALDEAYIPVEKAIEKLVVPLANKCPVLLLVLDGMSEAVYRELTEDVIKQGWLELQEQGKQSEQCLLAALPTVTKISRCSLLSGRLVEGVASDEKKAFSANAALKKIASTKFPPTVFHKQDLQQAASGALNDNVRAKIASTEYKVLSVVINAIDDQLSSSSQVSVDWTLDSNRIPLLRQVMEAAREAGRVVVMTSDHGHVLDHDSFYQQTNADNGERYQLNSDAVSEYEVSVSGERVVTADHSVVLPWTERLRYSKSKSMGYHGGASLQEVVIPLGIFVSTADTEVPEGWLEVSRDLPQWWNQEPAVAEMDSENSSAVLDVPVIRQSKKVKQAKAAAEVMDDMFSSDRDARSALETQAAIDKKDQAKDKTAKWIDSLFTSAVYQQIKARAGRTVVKEEQLRLLIEVIDQHKGQVMEAIVLRHLAIPKIRLRGFLAGAQKLLNVDGYPILSVERDTQTIKLNIADLKKQFELEA